MKIVYIQDVYVYNGRYLSMRNDYFSTNNGCNAFRGDGNVKIQH